MPDRARQQRQNNSADQERNPQQHEAGEKKKNHGGDHADDQEAEDDRKQARTRDEDAAHAVALLAAHPNPGRAARRALVADRRDDFRLDARPLRALIGVLIVGHDDNVGWRSAEGNA
jgi:hypothetical protein